MKKYIKLFTSYISKSLTYRTQIFGYVLMWSIATMTFIVLWLAVYRDGGSVGGYSLDQVILYYLFILLVSFITETSMGDELSSRIRKGEISGDLLKPYRLWIDKFCEELGSKVTYLTIPFPFFLFAAILVLIGLGIDLGSFITLESLSLFIVISGLAFFLNFLIEYLVASLAFWMDETWSLIHFKIILFSTFGGLSFPIDLLQGHILRLFEFLPFKYLYYIPVSYITGKRLPDEHLLIDIIGIVVWMMVLVLLVNYFWKKGLKRYGAFGN